MTFEPAAVNLNLSGPSYDLPSLPSLGIRNDLIRWMPSALSQHRLVWPDDVYPHPHSPSDPMVLIPGRFMRGSPPPEESLLGDGRWWWWWWCCCCCCCCCGGGVTLLFASLHSRLVRGYGILRLRMGWDGMGGDVSPLEGQGRQSCAQPSEVSSETIRLQVREVRTGEGHHSPLTCKVGWSRVRLG